MNQLQNLLARTRIWQRFFPPVQHLAPGVYHYQAPADAPAPYRLHLRIEPNGQGLLIVNASTVVHLNPTATEYAYHLVQNTPEEQAVAEIARRYDVRKEIVRRDYHFLIERLQALINTPDLDPNTYLEFGREEPYTGATLAPYRLDCALTYRLPEEGRGDAGTGGHGDSEQSGPGHYAPLERVSRELDREEWQRILDKAWQAGVPQVIFTGGEPTLRPDLVQLIAYAEQLGMVSGLITDGLRLADAGYLHEVLQSGLDYVMILLDPNDEQSWEALRVTQAEDIAVTVHLTQTRENLAGFGNALDRLATMGVQNISLSTETLGLKDDLQACRAEVAERHMRLVWDLPVPYSHYHPVALELAEEIPGVDVSVSGPGKAWLYVEPDGDVLPGQGYYQDVLGNLLTDSWETIWNKAGAS